MCIRRVLSWKLICGIAGSKPGISRDGQGAEAIESGTGRSAGAAIIAAPIRNAGPGYKPVGRAERLTERTHARSSVQCFTATQTTLSPDEFDAIISVLRRRLPHIQASRAQDICYASENRQRARKSIEADLRIVGPENRSRFQCTIEDRPDRGRTAHLIDDEADFAPFSCAAARRVGMSAGATRRAGSARGWFRRGSEAGSR